MAVSAAVAILRWRSLFLISLLRLRGSQQSLVQFRRDLWLRVFIVQVVVTGDFDGRLELMQQLVVGVVVLTVVAVPRLAHVVRQEQQGPVVLPLRAGELFRRHQQLIVLVARNHLPLDAEIVAQSLPLGFDDFLCCNEKKKDE